MVVSISNKLWSRALKGDIDIIRSLQQILLLISSGRHKLIFEQDLNLDDIMESSHFLSYAELIQAQAKQSFYKNKKDKLIIRITDMTLLSVTPNLKFYFNDLLAIEETDLNSIEYLDYTHIESYLVRPLYIVVENSISDKTFIQTIYNSVISSGIEIDPSVEKPLNMNGDSRIEFRLGGGTTTPQVIQSFIFPTRAICIIDGDKKFPTQQLDPKLNLLIEECENRNIKIIILNKREIENYIPEKAIHTWLSRHKRISELSHPYFSFSEYQKSFFDLKKGLKVKDYLQEGEINNLYNEVFRDTDLSILDLNSKLIDGFGSNVWEAFNEISCSLEDFGEDCIEEFLTIVTSIHTKV